MNFRDQQFGASGPRNVKGIPHSMVGGGPPPMMSSGENKRKLDAAYAPSSMMGHGSIGLTVDHLCQFLSIRKDPNFPSAVMRNTEGDMARIPYSNAMLSTMMTCMNHVSGLIYPANPKQLCTEASRAQLSQVGIMPPPSIPFGAKSTQSQKALRMASSMCQFIKTLPKTSPQNDLLMYHLNQHFTQNEVYDLFHLTPNEIEEKEFATSDPAISTLTRGMHSDTKKRHLSLDSEDSKKKKGKKSSLPTPVLYHLTALFRSDVKITTKAMLPRLKLMCDQNRIPWLQGYTETQLHTKFNSMKHKYKKSNQLPELPRMS